MWFVVLIFLIVIIAGIDWYLEYLSHLSIKEADDKLAQLLQIVDTKLDKILTAAKQSGVKEGVAIKLDDTVKEVISIKAEKVVETVAEKVAEKVVEKTTVNEK